jgi:NAD(P)-dependent dehydrogenase (short-subunit alcohol dehydrogenase family)
MLITGAGRGLGRAQALLLASRGARVVVADNGTAMDGEEASRGPAESVVTEIQAAGGEAIACTADLAGESGAEEAVQACLRSFDRIDGIIHYASTCPDLGTADQLSTRDFELVMRINAFAGLWMARAAWPHMMRQGYGRIVYMTSGGAYGGMGSGTYAAAKASIIGLMRCLAIEGAGQGIMVNAVAPSAHTRMTDRFQASAYADWFFETMAPEKVASAVAWLASEACDIHGEVFAIGGGRIARITLAETEGVIGSGASIEEAGELMPRVMADQSFFYPKDLAERSGKVAALFGFDGSLSSSSGFAVRPIDRS